jgi:hypothetical protein
VALQNSATAAASVPPPSPATEDEALRGVCGEPLSLEGSQVPAEKGEEQEQLALGW